jgi:hypothetical protein
LRSRPKHYATSWWHSKERDEIRFPHRLFRVAGLFAFLNQGIRDGFLAPYKVVKVHIDRDVEGYRPQKGQLDREGEEVEDRIYNMCPNKKQSQRTCYAQSPKTMPNWAWAPPARGVPYHMINLGLGRLSLSGLFSFGPPHRCSRIRYSSRATQLEARAMLLLRERFSRPVSENLLRTVFGLFVAGLVVWLAVLYWVAPFDF